MKLFEFEGDDRDLVVLTGVVSQIYNRMKDTGFNEPYSLRALLGKLEDRDMYLDRDQFIEMIKNPPLKNLIANVKGDDIIFKGVSSDAPAPEADETEKTLKGMAKKAMKLPK